MYNNLDQSKHQIRLLRLLPGHDSNAIHCELLIVSLDESNEFEALSYVWGSQRDLIQICVSGQIKYVTSNLASALHHLRNEENERKLWADAVCINQDDNDERNSQVQLMQQIYSGASRVVVWLGPLNNRDQEIINLIKRLGSNLRLHWIAIPKMGQEFFLRLYMFLRHEWWSRIWTVQEAVLAKQMTYYRGKVRLSNHDLTNMAASYKEHVYTTRCCNALTVPDKFGFDVAGYIKAVTDDILHMRQFRLGIRQANFDKVALLFRSREATDPRDHVYGLLGISCGIKESSINYNFSKAKVYELTTRDSLSHDNHLNILSHTFHQSTDTPGKKWSVCWPKDTPTWVPDWTIKHQKDDIDSMRYRLSFLEYYNACGPWTYKSTDDDPAGKLYLAGVRCDTIEAISSEVLGSPDLTNFDIIRDWRNMVGMEKAPGKAYVGGDTVSEAFWRTLCLDIRQSESVIRRAGADERGAHLGYWYIMLYHDKSSKIRIPKKESNFMKGVLDFYDHVAIAMTQRRFFISHKGYIGLAPLGVEVGDHICVFAGGRVPFIVRAVQQNNDPTMSRLVCRLLGDSYVHGLMDGEATKLMDDGVFQVQDFELI
ncbi:HET-domain-containing protein [Xylaria curta]|nr:HET-domain-containing protein [Xylaria curta]